MIVADSDVLIDFLAGRNPAADCLALELERGTLVTTAINRFELLCGARTPREERPILQLLEALPVLALDQPAADHAAAVRRSLRRKGADIGMGDCLIAGIVMRHSGILLTRNRRHFDRVEGLQLSLLPLDG